jgi:hypothetical protein
MDIYNKTMHKYYTDVIILIILCAIVIYYLVTNSNIYEGLRISKRKRKRVKHMINMKKQKQINKVNTNDTKINKVNTNDTKINKVNTNDTKINTVNTNATKISAIIKDIDKFTFFKKNISNSLNQLNNFITKNSIKNSELNKYTKEQGKLLQGNIDMLSSDVAINNMNCDGHIAKINNKLKTLNFDINRYENNNQQVEEVLNKLNSQLKTKYAT